MFRDHHQNRNFSGNFLVNADKKPADGIHTQSHTYSTDTCTKRHTRPNSSDIGTKVHTHTLKHTHSYTLCVSTVTMTSVMNTVYTSM